MRFVLKVRYVVLLCLASLVCVGCGDVATDSKSHHNELLSKLADGDLLFRKGTGVVGRIVTSVDSEGQYSHVGIVTQRDGEWCVVHAVPDEHEFKGDFDRVKCEPVERFASRYPNADLGLYRPQVTEEQVRVAVNNALRLSDERVHFDHDYDLTDTTKLYCTELVEYVYSLAGVSLSEGRRTNITFIGMSGPHIMPSDLTQSKLLKPIF